MAAAPDPCVHASKSQEPAGVVAVVSWHEEHQVHIEIAARSEGRWFERQITFSPEDPPLQRWQAAGYAIGTLVGARRELEGASATDTRQAVPPRHSSETTVAEKGTETNREENTTGREPSRSESARPSGATARSPSSPAKSPSPASLERFHFDAGLAVGSGWSDSLRYGPHISLGTRLFGGPFLRAHGGFAMSGHRFNVSTEPVVIQSVWGTGGLTTGMSWMLGSSTGAEIGAGAGIEYVETQIENGSSPPRRALGTLHSEVCFRQKLGGRIGLALSTFLGVRWGETGIYVDDTEIGRIPLFFGGARLAASFNLWLAPE